MKSNQLKYCLIIGFFVLLSFILGKFVNNINQNSSTPVKPTPVEIYKNPVEQIVRKSTVLITGVRSGSGSGVIIRSNQKYYVLTAKHVVGTAPGPQNQYEIKSYDGNVYLTITAKDYDQLVAYTSGDIDLTLIELPIQKKENYTSAKLSRGLSESISVWVSGWQKCLPEPQYAFTPGKISENLLSEKDIGQLSANDDELYLHDKDSNYQDGYRVKYTNPTLSGMSGGPVFNGDGSVVAIHGTAGVGKDIKLQKCQSLKNPKLGNNWGIPISLFLESNLAKGKNFDEDKQPVKPAKSTPQPFPINTTPSSDNDDPIFKCTETGKREGWCK